MKQLLVAAHGSRRASSNEDLSALVASVTPNLGENFDGVSAAFLEFASPSIEEKLTELFEQDATEVVVLPYFLSAGNHVVRDIPNIVDSVMSEFPGKKVNLLSHIGAFEAMSGVIVAASQLAKD